MDKVWYKYTKEYYSAIKRSTFESALMRWMNLKPIIQSEVSQKEKVKYKILTHIYCVYHMCIYHIHIYGTEELIYRAAMETQIENRLMNMERGQERARHMERVTWKLTLPYVK